MSSSKTQNEQRYTTNTNTTLPSVIETTVGIQEDTTETAVELTLRGSEKCLFCIRVWKSAEAAAAASSMDLQSASTSKSFSEAVNTELVTADDSQNIGALDRKRTPLLLKKSRLRTGNNEIADRWKSKMGFANQSERMYCLAVCEGDRISNNLRFHKLVENSPGSLRFQSRRSVPLSDVSKLDGFGLPAGSSAEFAVFFSDGKRDVWFSRNPIERATFLWAVLKTSASKLGKAPPVEGLRLLELQTLADTSSEAKKISRRLGLSGGGGFEAAEVSLPINLLSPVRKSGRFGEKNTIGRINTKSHGRRASESSSKSMAEDVSDNEEEVATTSKRKPTKLKVFATINRKQKSAQKLDDGGEERSRSAYLEVSDFEQSDPPDLRRSGLDLTFAGNPGDISELEPSGNSEKKFRRWMSKSDRVIGGVAAEDDLVPKSSGSFEMSRKMNGSRGMEDESSTKTTTNQPTPSQQSSRASPTLQPGGGNTLVATRAHSASESTLEDSSTADRKSPSTENAFKLADPPAREQKSRKVSSTYLAELSNPLNARISSEELADLSYLLDNAKLESLIGSSKLLSYISTEIRNLEQQSIQDVMRFDRNSYPVDQMLASLSEVLDESSVLIDEADAQASRCSSVIEALESELLELDIQMRNSKNMYESIQRVLQLSEIPQQHFKTIDRVVKLQELVAARSLSDDAYVMTAVIPAIEVLGDRVQLLSEYTSLKQCDIIASASSRFESLCRSVRPRIRSAIESRLSDVCSSSGFGASKSSKDLNSVRSRFSIRLKSKYVLVGDLVACYITLASGDMDVSSKSPRNTVRNASRPQKSKFKNSPGTVGSPSIARSPLESGGTGSFLVQIQADSAESLEDQIDQIFSTSQAAVMQKRSLLFQSMIPEDVASLGEFYESALVKEFEPHLVSICTPLYDDQKSTRVQVHNFLLEFVPLTVCEELNLYRIFHKAVDQYSRSVIKSSSEKMFSFLYENFAWTSICGIFGKVFKVLWEFCLRKSDENRIAPLVELFSEFTFQRLSLSRLGCHEANLILSSNSAEDRVEMRRAKCTAFVEKGLRVFESACLYRMENVLNSLLYRFSSATQVLDDSSSVDRATDKYSGNSTARNSARPESSRPESAISIKAKDTKHGNRNNAGNERPNRMDAMRMFFVEFQLLLENCTQTMLACTSELKLSAKASDAKKLVTNPSTETSSETTGVESLKSKQSKQQKSRQDVIDSSLKITAVQVRSVIERTAERVISSIISNTELVSGRHRYPEAFKVQTYFLVVQRFDSTKKLCQPESLKRINRLYELASTRYFEKLFNKHFERLVQAASESSSSAPGKVSKAVSHMTNVSAIIQAIVFNFESDIDRVARPFVMEPLWRAFRLFTDEKFTKIGNDLSEIGLRNEMTLVLSLRKRVETGMRGAKLNTAV